MVLQQIQPGWFSAGYTVCLVLIATGLLLTCFRRLRHTTLVAPWCWSLLAVWSAGSVEVVLGVAAEWGLATEGRPLRFLAASTTLLPIISLLGAKRPQHRAWQFVVLALWVVLTLPAARALVLTHRNMLEIDVARGWLLWIVILVGTLNYAPTRFAASAMLLGLSQACFFAEQLPLVHLALGTAGSLLGMTLALFALALPALGIPPGRYVQRSADRLWLSFRDMFGVLWGLRLAERINASSTRYDWGTTITWSGLRPLATTADAQTPQSTDALCEELKSLMLRFVSREWIAENQG